jgi:hypothetical protein
MARATPSASVVRAPAASQVAAAASASPIETAATTSGATATEGACWPLPRYDAAAIDPGGDTGGRTSDADAAGLDANLDAAGLDAAGLDADLDAAGLDAAGLDGGTGPAMCTGTLFSGVDWRELHAGVNASVSIAASVAGRLVFSTVTNFVTGPGGELHVLDVTSAHLVDGALPCLAAAHEHRERGVGPLSERRRRGARRGAIPTPTSPPST